MTGNPSVKKRQKEAARKQRRREKAARRDQRKVDRASRVTTVASGEDPDLAGIVPGPQPVADDVDEFVQREPVPSESTDSGP